MPPTREDFLSTGLAPVAVDAIPSSDRTCAICLEPYATAHSPVRLPCTHILGLPCIATWLAQPGTNTCPFDRRALFALPSLAAPQLQLAGPAPHSFQWLYDPLVHLRAVLADEWHDSDRIVVRADQLVCRLPQRRRGDVVLPGFWGRTVAAVAETPQGKLAQDIIGERLRELDGQEVPLAHLYELLEGLVLRRVGQTGMVLPERFGVFLYRVLRYLINWQRLLQGGESRGHARELDAFYVPRT